MKTGKTKIQWIAGAAAAGGFCFLLLLVLSGKGGTGKTTVASALIRLAKARAFADCDVDAPNLHLLLAGASQPEQEDYEGLPKAVIETEKCLHCGLCQEQCRFDAIRLRDGHFAVEPFACEGYWEVLQQDPRCILHYTSGWFIMQLYPVHPEECRACLIWAFEQSETEQDLVRNAAHILAELCIKGDLDVHAYLFQRQYMPEQAYGILDQCFDDLNQEPKNTAAKRLLLYTLQNCQEIPQHIVWQYCREPGPHDPDVLRLFVERCANRAEYALIHFFLESRKENSPAWWENLYTFCARACADATKRYGLAVDDFCKLPFLLLETAATVQQREKALDVFDETFRSNVIQMENFLRETNR